MSEPRIIKPEDIEGYILSEHFFNAHDAVTYNAGGPTVAPPEELKRLTFCVIVLKNGFTVTGESACADPRKYNKEIGEKIARANALNKVWPLMGYVLRSQLAGVSGLLEPEGYKDRARRELEELQIRITKLRAYLAGEIPTEQREDLEGQLDGMVVYCSFLERRVRQF